MIWHAACRSVEHAGRQAGTSPLDPGDFFGEGCLAGQLIRIGSATAIPPSSVLVIEKKQMEKENGDGAK